MFHDEWRTHKFISQELLGLWNNQGSLHPISHCIAERKYAKQLWKMKCKYEQPNKSASLINAIHSHQALEQISQN